MRFCNQQNSFWDRNNPLIMEDFPVIGLPTITSSIVVADWGK